MKLTVGQLTAQHIGMHIRVGEHADGTGWSQDGQLWAVTHKEEATWVSLDLKGGEWWEHENPCHVETVEEWAAAETFGRQECPHCREQHPGQSCPLHDAAQQLPLEEEE